MIEGVNECMSRHHRSLFSFVGYFYFYGITLFNEKCFHVVAVHRCGDSGEESRVAIRWQT